MRYDITKPTVPAMLYRGKGTEGIRLLLSQASNDMYEPLVPILFPSSAHTSAARNFSTRTTVGRNRRA